MADHGGTQQRRQLSRRQPPFRLLTAQILEHHHLLGRLAVADHRRPGGTGAVGPLELFAEGGTAEIELHRQSLLTQLAGQAEGAPLGELTAADHVQIRPGDAGRGAGLLQQQHQPLHAQGPAHRRRGRTAQLTDKPVVATTAADRRLGSQLVAGDLEGGVAVVIEAAHQARIEPEGKPQILQAATHPLEALVALGAEGIVQIRCPGQQRLGVGVLGIKDAQRVALQPLLGIGIQPVAMGLEPGDQLAAVAQAILRSAQRIELQLQTLHAQIGQQIPGQGDRLDVATRIGETEQLDADLMELTLAPRLGALIAEHRAAVPEPLRSLGQQAVLNHGAHHRGGALGPQRAAALAAVQEGVHLLAHHIGGFADAAGEQLGGLQQRRADLLHAGATEVLPRRGLQVLPQDEALRQQIDHAAQALERFHGREAGAIQCALQGVLGLPAPLRGRARHGGHRPRRPGAGVSGHASALDRCWRPERAGYGAGLWMPIGSAPPQPCRDPC